MSDEYGDAAIGGLGSGPRYPAPGSYSPSKVTLDDAHNAVAVCEGFDDLMRHRLTLDQRQWLEDELAHAFADSRNDGWRRARFTYAEELGRLALDPKTPPVLKAGLADASIRIRNGEL